MTVARGVGNKAEKPNFSTWCVASSILLLLTIVSSTVYSLPMGFDAGNYQDVSPNDSKNRFIGQHIDVAIVLQGRISANEFTEINARFAAGRFGKIIQKAESVIAQKGGSSLAYEIIGAAYLLSGKFGQAQQALEKAIRLDKTQSGPMTKLGILHMELGDIAKAKEILLKAIKANKKDRHAHQRLGLLYQYEKSYEKAAYHLRQGLKETPKSYIGVAVNLGLVLNTLKRYSETVEVLSERLPISSNIAEAQSVLATALLGSGKDFEEASKRFERLLELKPGSISARLGLAITMRKNGDKQGAISKFEAIISEQPQWIPAILELGETQLSLNQIEWAHKTFDRAIMLGADHNTIERRVAKYYQEQGNFHKAGLVLKKARDSGNADEETYIMLSEVYQAAAKYSNSIDTLEAGVVKYSNSAYLWFRLGALRAALGRYTEAIRALQRAKKINPNDTTLIKALSLALAKAGDSSGAAKEAERLYQLMPRQNDVAVFYAIRLIADNQRIAGKRVYREVLQSAPNHLVALNNLSNLLIEEKKYKKAERYAIKANEISQNNAMLLDTLAWVYYKQGRYKNALQLLDRASNLSSELSIIWYHKGKTLNALNMKNDASKAFDKAIEIDPEADWAKEVN